MENYFRELSDVIFEQLNDEEVLLLNYRGEDSDFVRFNHCKIRQAGHVRQQRMQLNLIANQRQSQCSLNLSEQLPADRAQAQQLLAALRQQLEFLPPDPFINYSTDPHNTRHVSDNNLPKIGEVVETITDTAQDLDLVGIWASGEMSQGFANSLGQFNWHADYNFNFDWSAYHQGDKAVKQNYAGFKWDPECLEKKLVYTRETLPLLGKDPRTILPGSYRVYLAPAALEEILQLLCWGGFGLKSHRTAQTPLLKMVKENVTLSPQLHITENHQEGLVAGFTQQGFILPNSVSLIDAGVYQHCLANQRSAKEYGETVNCDVEQPRSMQVRGGDLPQDDILKELGTGAYISNLWYCNYSDRNNGRITGMTRFASLWVENGVPVAPLSVMRFDESVLDMLGTKLIALTKVCEHSIDPCSYEHRSNASSYLPGALVEGFTFTL